MNQIHHRGRPLRRLVTGLLDLIYPPVCLRCDASLPAGSGEAFCETCLTNLRTLAHEVCPRCAAPVGQFTVTDGRCRYCQEESFAFTQALTLGKYEGALRELILRMKHTSGESIGYHLTNRLVEDQGSKLRSWPVDAVIPVPLHWSRRLWRGYNQASVIAEVIARRIGKPCKPRWLWRRRQTPPQYTVTPDERRKNLRRAFAARLPGHMKGRNLLLADDVMTTGSTADACARALRAAGAKEVYVVVLARAIGQTGLDSPSRIT